MSIYLSFLHEKRVPRAQLKEWTGKLTGLRDEGEKVCLFLPTLAKKRANKGIDHVEAGQARSPMARRSKRCKSTWCMGILGGSEAQWKIMI